MKKSTLFMAPKVAFAQCAVISTTGITLRDMIQQVAMSAIFHSVQSQNNDIGIKLFESMVDGLRKQSLVTYLETYGNFSWDKDAKALVHVRNPANERDTAKLSAEQVTELHAVLSANPWYDASGKEEICTTLDVAAEVTKLIKRIQKSVKKGHTVTGEGSLAEIMLAYSRGEKVSVNIVPA